MFHHIADAIKKPDFVELDSNLYIARFESMKIYSTLYAVKKLLDEGVIDSNTTLIDSSSGIYAYALALACHKYSLKCHIVASKTVDEAVKVQLELLGAYVDGIPPLGNLKLDQKYRVEKINAIMEKMPNYYWMRQYHDDIHYGGYEEFADNIADELKCSSLTLVGGVGSGCSTGATAGFLRKKGLSVNLCGLQPFGSMTFGAENIEDPEIIIAGIGSAIEFLNVKHGYYDSINWLSFGACLSGAIDLMKRYAIFAGLSSGGSYCVARREARIKPHIPCLLIAPDTGHRYVENVFKHYKQVCPIDMLKPQNIKKARELVLPWSRMEWERRGKAFLPEFAVGSFL